MQKGNIVQNSNAVRGSDILDNVVSKGFIAGAKNIGAANNGGLQNRIVVRVAYNGRRNVGQLHQNAGRFQKNKVLFNGFSREGPTGMNVRVGQHALKLDQNRRRKDKYMRSRYDCQKEIAGKPLRGNFGVGTDEDIRIKNNPHGCQLRRGRTCDRAS